MQTIKTTETSVAALESATPVTPEQAATVTLETMMTELASEVAATRQSFATFRAGGLSAVSHAAVLAWTATARFGADRKAIAMLVLGKEKPESDGHTGKDTAEAKVFRQAKRLAMHWRTKGVPPGFVGFVQANNFTGSVECAANWLNDLGVRSIDGLHAYLSDAHPRSKTEKPLAERIANSVRKAAEQAEFSTVDAGKLAELLVSAVGDEANFLAFGKAWELASEQRHVRMRENASKRAELVTQAVVERQDAQAA